MAVALWLMLLQALIGAFDTVYYHEWKARLPALGQQSAPELRLHAARDFLYAVLFTTLPWFEWHGAWLIALVPVIVAEIVLTLADFVIEKSVRKPMGDVYEGERITHAIMGILYGAMIAYMIPELITWATLPTAFVSASPNVPAWVQWTLSVMGLGVLASGLRDLYASFELPFGSWPWKVQ